VQGPNWRLLIPNLHNALLLVTIMKKLIYTSAYIILCLTSCRQKNCDLSDLKNKTWQQIDSTTSYHLCSNSATKLNTKDSIDIKYLGTLLKEENILVQNDKEEALFIIFKKIQLGRLNCNDTTINKSVRVVVEKLTKNSEAIIKIKLNDFKPSGIENKVTVFFNNSSDSIKEKNWINEIKAKPFIDSTIYISKSAALKNFSQDLNDSTWLNFMNENPLPTSVELFINPNYFNETFVNKLKKEFEKLNFVTEVTYSNLISEESIMEISEILKKEYFIKVSAKK
jgi:FtsX extracellular domain